MRCYGGLCIAIIMMGFYGGFFVDFLRTFMQVSISSMLGIRGLSQETIIFQYLKFEIQFTTRNIMVW
jgi:hypothetical protein